MSQAWSQWHDVERLSAVKADIDFAILAAEFPRLPPQPARPIETLRGQVQFRREGGFAVAELSVTGGVQLICQRCLKYMRQPVDGHARIALVVSETEADRVPPEFEPVRAPEGCVRVLDLVEEEVLLALPIVPLHEDLSECVPAAALAKAEAQDAPHSMQKPFERLGELLKR